MIFTDSLKPLLDIAPFNGYLWHGHCRERTKAEQREEFLQTNEFTARNQETRSLQF